MKVLSTLILATTLITSATYAAGVCTDKQPTNCCPSVSQHFQFTANNQYQAGIVTVKNSEGTTLKSTARIIRPAGLEGKAAGAFKPTSLIFAQKSGKVVFCRYVYNTYVKGRQSNFNVDNYPG